jgi:hypothetical protein
MKSFRYFLLLPLLLVPGELRSQQNLNCSAITFDLVSDSPGNTAGCVNSNTSVMTFNETMAFSTRCYQTVNGSTYNTQTPNLIATGQCVGAGAYYPFALICQPPKGFQPDGTPNGAPYIWKKTIPVTAPGTYNQLYFTPKNNFFIPATDTCSPKDGSPPMLIQCSTLACPCVPTPHNSCGSTSPLVIDTTGNGFQMVGWESGPKFDMMGTGTPVQMAWPAKGSGVGFLALPDVHGLVTSGLELFGNQHAANGFDELAVYAQPDHGGCGKDYLSPCDLIWDALRLWIDNGDGISTPDEMHKLAEFDISKIDLHYHLSPWVDVYGNQFKQVAFINEKADHRIYDVWLVLCPNP